MLDMSNLINVSFDSALRWTVDKFVLNETILYN